MADVVDSDQRRVSDVGQDVIHNLGLRSHLFHGMRRRLLAIGLPGAPAGQIRTNKLHRTLHAGLALLKSDLISANYSY